MFEQFSSERSKELYKETMEKSKRENDFRSGKELLLKSKLESFTAHDFDLMGYACKEILNSPKLKEEGRDELIKNFEDLLSRIEKIGRLKNELN